ncbi:MAG: hypothetical protein ACLGHN_08305 [Bacteriovoracia bacterium]
MKALYLLTLALFLVSCSSVSRKQMTEEINGYSLPHKPERGEAIVYVLRPSFLGSLIRFNVYLGDKEDESEMGWNRGSQYIYFFVKPGKHKLYSVAENTAEYEFEAKEGEAVFVEQETNFGIIMARNQLNHLDKTAGTYYVKKLRKGNIIKERKAVGKVEK